jgi:hypothetical protein
MKIAVLECIYRGRDGSVSPENRLTVVGALDFNAPLLDIRQGVFHITVLSRHLD